jgi:hypothetical protein
MTQKITLDNMSKDKIYYGIDGKFIECTDKLKTLLIHGFVNINEKIDKIVGDPFPGKRKSSPNPELCIV